MQEETEKQDPSSHDTQAGIGSDLFLISIDQSAEFVDRQQGDKEEQRTERNGSAHDAADRRGHEKNAGRRPSY